MTLNGFYCRPMAGWLAGCITATLFVCFLGPIYLAIASGKFFDTLAAVIVWGALFFIIIAPLIFIIVSLLSGLPAAILISLSEMLRLRSVVFFVVSGSAIGALSQFAFSRGFWPAFPAFGPLFVAAGAAAGFAYWFVAGKHAGGDTAG